MYHPEFLEKMHGAIIRNDAELVICGYSIGENGKFKDKYSRRKNRKIEKDDLYTNILLSNEIGGFCWNKLFRRKIIDDIRFDENVRICEDMLFLFQYTKKISNIYYITDSLYYYTLREDSATMDIKKVFSQNKTLLYTDTFNKILQHKLLDNIQLNNMYACIYQLSLTHLCKIKNMNIYDKETYINLRNDINKYKTYFYFNKNIKIIYKIKVFMYNIPFYYYFAKKYKIFY